jgi:hypothetical protein
MKHSSLYKNSVSVIVTFSREREMGKGIISYTE